jgi:hypothetical protein
MKNRLIFDTTDANTIADSDSVGAYVRSSDGTLIDHATINSVERLAVDSTLKDGSGNALTSTAGALDVNLASPLAVDVDMDGVYDVGTNPTPDSAGMIAHVRAATPDETDQTFRSTGGTASADDVVAANVHGLDVNSFGMVFDGTAWDRLRGTAGAVHINDGGNSITVDGTVSISGDVNVTQGTSPWVIGDGGGSITVDATDLDIRDLDAATDSVAAWTHDGTGNAIGSTAGALDVYVTGSAALTINDAALANTAIANSANALNAANTAEAVVGSALANRKYLWIHNNGNRIIYVGGAGVSAANGFPLAPSSVIEMRAGAAVGVNWVGPNTSQEIRVLELS